MSTLNRVEADEARRLTEEEGYLIIDVRAVAEYEKEHAAGAYNVPYLNKGEHGMVPNEDFIEVVRGLFPDAEAKLITTCQMGGRSVRAAQELRALGYHKVVDLRGGFGGERDDAGQVILAGWVDRGLPVEEGAPAERGYAALKAKAGLNDPNEAVPEPASAAAPPPSGGGENRFAHPSATIFCSRYKENLAAIKRTPMGGPLGKRIKQEISARAWNDWVEHSKLLINEYRLNPAEPKAQQMLMEQCEEFLFGAGGDRPDEFQPK